MARINVNLKEVEIPSGKPHPDGPLHVRVKKATVKDAKSEGGFPYVNYQLEPVGTDNKSHVWLKCSTHPDALWNTKLFLDALGVAYDPIDGSYDTDDTLGKECKVTASASEFNGKPTNEIKPPYYKV